MHLKTALVAVAAAATVGVAAQSDYGDTLSSIYSKAGLSVVISTAGKVPNPQNHPLAVPSSN